MSRVSRVVSAVESKMLWRVIGSVDAVGQGTNHELNDVNPFVLFDHAKPMHKKGTPPFGIHPHHGLHVASLLWEGVLENRVGLEPESTLFGNRSSFYHGWIRRFARRKICQRRFAFD